MKKIPSVFRFSVVGGLVLCEQTSAVAQVIIYAPADLASVPTLSEWGVMVLAGLIGATGIYFSRNAGNKVLSLLFCTISLVLGVGAASELVGNAQALPNLSMHMNGGGSVDLSGYVGSQDIPVNGNSALNMRIVSVVPASGPTSSRPTCAAGVVIAAGSRCYYRSPASGGVESTLIAQSFVLADRCSVIENVSGNWKELSQAHISNSAQPLSAVIKSAASKGVAVISGDVVSYQPDLDSEYLDGDSFVITISGGGVSADVTVSLGDYFSVNSACSSDTAGLDSLVQSLPSNLEVLLVVGHAAAGERCQQRLSESRARAVKDYVLANPKGVEENRIYVEGKGANYPAVSGSVNSRVEVQAADKSHQVSQVASVNFPANIYKVCH